MNENKNDCLDSLNNKFTPQKNKKIRNPFDRVLVERLHQPLSSPSMCKIYKSKTKGTFIWDIEEASTLTPAEIVVCNSQYEGSPDPVLEKFAEEATEKYFSQELVVPSPMEPSKKQTSLILKSPSSSQEFGHNKPISETCSTQTELTLPPILPPEIEKILRPFCTFSQGQALLDECERTANGSFRVKTVFSQFDYSDHHYDSEQTDDESHEEKRPASSFEGHASVEFSPDLSNNLVSKGMKRTFETPLKGDKSHKPFKNKILDIGEFETCMSPIQCATPKRSSNTAMCSSLSISPLKTSDDEKNCMSPEAEAMATCLNCVHAKTDSKKDKDCFCTPNNLFRSTSLKESPHKNTKGSSMGKRSLSMTSLNRSRSVQKLDFSMDMSVDGSPHNMTQGSEISSPQHKQVMRSHAAIESSTQIGFFQESRDIQSSTKLNNFLDETPIKGKRRTNVAHEISKIRDCSATSPFNMSLDSSSDYCDGISLSMEDKIDFNSVDLKMFTGANTTVVDESSVKKIDSGFNDNTFYASSYYESAIKPSELVSSFKSKVLKEISNVSWLRADSGFKDETSSESNQFFESKRVIDFSSAKFNKENVSAQIISERKNDTMSISDYFNEDLTFTCNFSSTPSKSKMRGVNS